MIRKTVIKQTIEYQLKSGYLTDKCLYLLVFLLIVSNIVNSKERLVLKKSYIYETNINIFINNLTKNVNKYNFGTILFAENANLPSASHCYQTLACCYDKPYFKYSNAEEQSQGILDLEAEKIPDNSLLLVDSARVLNGQKQYNESIKLLNELFAGSHLENSDSLKFLATELLASNYYRLKKNERAIAYYKESLEIYDRLNINIHNKKSVIYRTIGLIYRRMKDMRSSAEFQKLAVECFEVASGKDEKTLAGYLFALAITISDNGNELDALNYFGKAEVLYQKQQNARRLLQVYGRMSRAYRDLGDYGKSIAYSEKIIFELGQDKRSGPVAFAGAYYDIALVHFIQENYDLAIENLNKSMSYPIQDNVELVVACYEYLALSYMKSGSTSNSIKNFKNAIEIIGKSFGEESEKLITSYMNFATALVDIGRSQEGFDYFLRAQNIASKSLNPDHPLNARIYRNIGLYYTLFNKRKEALNNYYKSLLVFSSDPMANDPYSIPELIDDKLGLDVISSLKKIGQTFYDIYYYENGGQKELLATLDYFDKALRTIDELRYNLTDEESKLFLSANEKETYTKSIEIANILYDQTRSAEYRERSFEFAERSKAVNLLSSIRNIDAVEVGGIPDSLQNKEKLLQEEVIAIKKELFDAKQKHFEESELSEIEDRLFNKTNEYERLIKEFEEKFESYYKLKYDKGVLSSSDIQSRIAENEIFVEYVISNNKLITFAISNTKFTTYTNSIDSVFFEDVDLILNSLTKINFALHKKSDFVSFITSANRLYKLLIAPLELEYDFTKLIITPDEILAYVPFEILITENPDKLKLDYRSLPYLLRDYIISYAFSGTLLYENEISHTRRKPEIMAFAANYEKFDELNDEKSKLIEPYKKVLIPLAKVGEEVANISKLTGAKVFSDSDATEENFIKNHQNYDILHLAMHTIIENEDPMFSKLAFTPTNASSDDGFLNTYEIYNLRMSAQLAVLSACNTGDGKLRKGEGVMSFARSFFYSGCPSVIMTLWPVEDKAGSGLMIDFYNYMSQGAGIGESLRQSKLNYLNNADPLRSHPFFWAGFVSIGQDQQLYHNGLNKRYYLFSLLLLIPLVVFVYFRIRKKA